MKVIERIKVWFSNIFNPKPLLEKEPEKKGVDYTAKINEIRKLEEENKSLDKEIEKKSETLSGLEKPENKYHSQMEEIKRLEKEVSSLDNEIKKRQEYLYQVLSEVERLQGAN